MTNEDPAKSLDELLEPGSTLMVGTASAGGSLEFRPLTVARVQGDRLEILLDTSAPWTKTVAAGDQTYVTVGDTRKNTWLSLSGSLSMTSDDSVIDELWNPFAAAYFDDGRDTPGIAVLYIDVDRGEYWTTVSGRIGSLISMVRAKFGDADQSGEHGAIRV